MPDAYYGWGIEAYILLQNDWSLPVFPRKSLTEAGFISWIRGDIGMCNDPLFSEEAYG